MTFKVIKGNSDPRYPDHKFEVWSDRFACYAQSRLVAHRARIELQKTLARKPERIIHADEVVEPYYLHLEELASGEPFYGPLDRVGLWLRGLFR